MKISYRLRRLYEHLWGPAGSVLLHVILIALLCHWVLISTPAKVERKIEVRMMDPVDSIPPKEWDDVFRKPPEDRDLDVPYEPRINEPALNEPPEIEPDMDAGPTLDPLDLPTVPATLMLKDMYTGRTGEGIQQRLKQYSYGFGAQTEPAVCRALDWLKRHQLPDGSWGEVRRASVQSRRYAVGLTGLALLTFLAHGETPQAGPYRDVVARGIRFLMNQQHPDTGAFTAVLQNPCDADQHDYGPYAHGIATYAISEAYGLTRIPELKTVMERAVAVIIEGQMPDGTWGYGYCARAAGRKDLSVSGWQVQALKAAKIAGAVHSGLTACLSNAVRGVERMQVSNGRFAYATQTLPAEGSGTDSMTGVGVLCLQLLGCGRAPAVRDGLAALRTVRCDWDDEPWGRSLHRTKTYDYYYITQAKFQRGHATWKRWNRRLAQELVAAQQDEGCWLGPESEPSITHKVYNTTLAALTLQVYYRFLPTYRQIPAADNVITHSDEDDVVIEII
jgi:hypothetical protein